MFTPRGHWHGFNNTSEEEVVLVWGWSEAGWIKAALEPEIAVSIGMDLPEAPDREAVRAAVVSVGPAIELADADFPPEDVDAMLAANLYNRNVILARQDPSRAGCKLDGLVGRLFRNETEVAATEDPQALTGELIEIARHAASLLAALGEPLRAPDVIITGSIVPPLRIEAPEGIHFSLDPIDTIAVNLTV